MRCRWVATIYLDDGKRKFIYRHTQEEAVIALQLANQAKMQGNLTSTHNETVEMFCMDWLRFRLQPRVRERTYQGYHDLIVKHILPTLGQIKLQKLTPMQIQQLYDLKRQQQYSPQTILSIHKLLRRVLEDAVYLHHVQYNVCQKVHPPRQPRGHIIAKALSIAEAKREQGEERWVFCNTRGKPLRASSLIRSSFRPLLEKAGIPPIRFHDLRHTIATLLLSMGTHPKIVQELLGQSQIIVTLEIYSHILLPLQEEAMLQFNTLLTAPDLS
ncbi:Phage_int_SAM_3 and DNA_BRE_C domain-containing protein [Ktedonobacteria bacterium brp13]|nr:Phage_int_SAM_3 and DNA_BRE_C domain-containing protein [Ktedonobacteria bacterium brp13]